MKTLNFLKATILVVLLSALTINSYSQKHQLKFYDGSHGNYYAIAAIDTKIVDGKTYYDYTNSEKFSPEYKIINNEAYLVAIHPNAVYDLSIEEDIYEDEYFFNYTSKDDNINTLQLPEYIDVKYNNGNTETYQVVGIDTTKVTESIKENTVNCMYNTLIDAHKYVNGTAENIEDMPNSDYMNYDNNKMITSTKIDGNVIVDFRNLYEDINEEYKKLFLCSNNGYNIYQLINPINFNDIEIKLFEKEGPTTSVNNYEENKMPFTQQGNTLVFTKDTNIAIYSLSGACIYKGTTQNYTLPNAGIYIVSTKEGNYKVLNK